MSGAHRIAESAPAVRAAELASSARHEVDAWLKFWQGDAEGALEQARAVLDALTGGRAPQRYAAL
jgi:hypothetical protein